MNGSERQADSPRDDKTRHEQPSIADRDGAVVSSKADLVSWAWIAFGLTVLGYAIGVLVYGVTSHRPAPRTDVNPIAIYGIFLVTGVVGPIIILVTEALEIRRNKLQKVKTSHAILLAAVAGVGAFFALAGLGTLAHWMASRGIALSADPAVAVEVRDGYLAFYWEALNAVPVLELAETIGWEKPITDPSAALGWLLAATRTLFVLVLIGLVVTIAKRVLSPPFDEQSPPATAGQPHG
jgi:hypothetical protein